MRTREHFEIKRSARRYDRTTGNFIVNISYETATDITPRTVAVAEAFGLGVDQHQRHIIYDNVELKISPKDVVLITGQSGSGKSVLLKALEKDIRQDLGSEVINIADVMLDPGKPLIDTVGKTLEEGLELLSRVGLNDAFLFVRRYNQLSDGQKYRYRIAKMIEKSQAQFWIADEFCSTLDRDTAKIVAFNLQKLARQEGKAVLVATTHTDLFEDLKPSVHVHKRFGKEIEVKYYPNEINKECSLVREMRIEQGTLQDYRKLAGFHYRDSKSVVACQKVFVLKRGDEVAGVIVYSSPAVAAFGRRKAFGRSLTLEEINRDVALISRVVVHPKYRTIGLGVKLVRETLPLAGKPYVETVAVMARYNPFFEHAGLTKISEGRPDPRILEAVEKLRALGFNPIFLSSEKANLEKLQRMSVEEVEQVKNIFKEVSRSSGVYRKRIMSVHEAYLTHEQFCHRVDKASIEKLAKMLRILSFLTQTKVYLFWKNPSCKKK